MRTTASTALVEPSSGSNRRQPVRQTRTNPPRNFLASSRSLGSSTLGGPQAGPKPTVAPGFFPGITFFTDAITALPREMIRHYTMLKEVDAKLYSPEDQLKRLVSEALDGQFRRLAPPETQLLAQDQSSAKASLHAGSISSDNPPAIQSAPSATNMTDPRSDHYELMRNIMVEVLKISDEKNHVMSTANEALFEHIARLESAWPEIEKEISEDTRYGNLKHWAYTDKTTEKKSATTTERTRREFAIGNGTSGTAGAAGDNEARGERGILSRKRAAPVIDSDFDDNGRQGKKNAQSGKRTKPAEFTAANIPGLGITSAPNPKRRRIDKPPNTTVSGAQPMEKALSSVQNSTARNGQAISREIPTTEPRKRTRGGATTAAGSRRRAGTVNSTVNSPNLASSPVIGSFSVVSKPAPSPAIGAAMQRSSSSRARQNSTTSIPQARGPDLTGQTNGNGMHAPIDTSKAGGSKAPPDAKGTKPEERFTSEPDKNIRSDRTVKREESVNARHRPPAISTAARNGGKASKTGTPLTSSFPGESSRPRSGRNNSHTTLEQPPKRSHKKGQGQAAQKAAAHVVVPKGSKEEDGSSMQGDEDEDPESEPRYCYCNGVSFGEMVACDMDGCEREWFHLTCVGMTKPPKQSSKWYCEDCKSKL